MPAPALSFSHFGFFVRDIERMAQFYTRLLGFAVSDRGQLGGTSLVFLTGDAREHHQIVLVSGRPEEAGFNPINQISFRVHDLARLRQMYRALQGEQGVSEIAPVSHGNALSVYFRDPEGNRIEIFCDTEWYIEQPCLEDLDLSLPADQIRAKSEAFCRTAPGFRPIAQYQAEVAAKMGLKKP